MITFHNHLQLTTTPSSPHLTIIFIGVLAEILFGTPGHNHFTTKQHGPWDPEAKSREIWGDEHKKWNWTSERDTARFVAGILSLPLNTIMSKQFWNVSSGVDAPVDIARIYSGVRGREVEVKQMGSVEVLGQKALEARAQGSKNNFWGYLGWFYSLYTFDGTWLLGDLNNEIIGVKGEGLKGWLERTPDA